VISRGRASPYSDGASPYGDASGKYRDSQAIVTNGFSGSLRSTETNGARTKNCNALNLRSRLGGDGTKRKVFR
jgi:hypothetical protein